MSAAVLLFTGLHVSYTHPLTKQQETVLVRTEQDIKDLCAIYQVRVRLAALTVDQAA